MNKKFATLITKDAIVISNGKKRFIVHNNHPNYSRIAEKVRSKNLVGIEQLVKAAERIEKIFNVVLKNNVVFYKGKPLHNVVTNKILTFMNEGLPYKPLVKFINNLLENPDQISIESLYNYLESQNLPITDDGCFLAAKAVTHDMMDKYSRTIKYVVGKTYSMERDKVSRSPYECSGPGYYCGSDKYVYFYGGGDDKYVWVKINPKDVCVVPKGESGKIRVCRYKIVSIVKKEDINFVSEYAPKNPNYKPNTKYNYLNQKRDANGRFIKS